MTTETNLPEQEEQETSQFSTGMSSLDYKEFAQARRINFIQRIEEATGGKIEMLEPDDKGHYLAAIRDIEKQALVLDKMKQDKELAIARMKSDEKNAAAVDQSIAQFLNELARNKNKRAEDGMVTEVIFDPSLIPQKQLINGETTIGDQIESYQQFQTRTGFDSDLDPAP